MVSSVPDAVAQISNHCFVSDNKQMKIEVEQLTTGDRKIAARPPSRQLGWTSSRCTKIRAGSAERGSCMVDFTSRPTTTRNNWCARRGNHP
jgi:hypothetical protein